MSSRLRSILALSSIVLAAPLTAQTTALGSTRMVATAATIAQTDTAVTWIELRSNQGKLRGKLPQLLKTEIARAKALGLTPFLELGATWCGPCRELEANLHKKDFIDAFSGAYMIHLDIDDWDIRSELGPLGYTQMGIPIIAALNKDGRLTSELEDDEYTAASIKKYVRANAWKK